MKNDPVVGSITFPPGPRTFPGPLPPDTELIDRIRRIETKLTRLCEFLGFDATAGISTRVRQVTEHAVEVVGMDTSMAELLLFCRRCGIHGRIKIIYKGLEIGHIDVTPERGI